ncbi:MAG: LysE family transporter, partial [Pseudomonadota bacterium]
MIDPFLLVQSALIGIAIAAPLGPANLVVISRTVRLGFVAGALSGLGAVIGDGIYAAISVFGITA